MIAGLQQLGDMNRGANVNMIGIGCLAPWPQRDEVFLGLWFLMSIVGLVDKRRTSHLVLFFVTHVSESHLPCCRFLECIVSKNNGHANITPSSIMALDHLCAQRI